METVIALDLLRSFLPRTTLLLLNNTLHATNLHAAQSWVISYPIGGPLQKNQDAFFVANLECAPNIEAVPARYFPVELRISHHLHAGQSWIFSYPIGGPLLKNEDASFLANLDCVPNVEAISALYLLSHYLQYGFFEV